MLGLISYSECNINGEWSVYGAIGIKQYFNCNKEQAGNSYRNECYNSTFYNDLGGNYGELHTRLFKSRYIN